MRPGAGALPRHQDVRPEHSYGCWLAAILMYLNQRRARPHAR